LALTSPTSGGRSVGINKTKQNNIFGFEVLTAVTTMSVVFWAVTHCSSERVGRFGATFYLHLQAGKQKQAKKLSAGFLLAPPKCPAVSYVALQLERLVPENDSIKTNTLWLYFTYYNPLKGNGDYTYHLV
jgi:hypothetical protein